MDWPPQVGEILPRAQRATGVRQKLANYSLDREHPRGEAKARGFELILGLSLDAIDYVEETIYVGIRSHPIVSVRENWPHGTACAVDIPIGGIGRHSARIVPMRTAWLYADPIAPPRLTNAYLKP
jgi:Domain of unknown function (DUF6883)